MKQVINKSGKIGVEEIPSPSRRKGFVIVKLGSSLISTGTELMKIGEKQSILSKALRNPKKVLKKIKNGNLLNSLKKENYESLGYSSAGTVVDKGEDVREFNIGDRVACAGADYAVHAEYINVPKNLVVKIPKDISFEEAAFTTIGSIAIQGVRRANPTFGETFVVIGLGLVGQLTAQILQAAGCRVLGMDLREDRIKMAKKLGLEAGFLSEGVKNVLMYTNQIGCDGVIICASTNNNKPLLDAMKICRKKGRVVLVGVTGMELERDLMYKKEIDFLISRSYGPGRYDPNYEERGFDYPLDYVRWTENRNMQEFLRLILHKKIDVKSLITDIFTIDKTPEAYEKISLGSLVVILKYNPEESALDRKKIVLNQKIVDKSKINIGVIGVGDFVQTERLPNLIKIKDYNIMAICDLNGVTAKKIANTYNAKYCTTDYKEILKDNEIDAVLIGTRHDTHAKLAVDAAKYGKHIFLEKPMALNEEQLNQIIKSIKKGNINFSVGFNRRYAPLSLKIKEFLKECRGPFIINYRVNTGFIPKEHWTNEFKEGGGRIIGEGCHMMDFFNFLLGEKPIEVKTVNLGSGEFYDRDNLVCCIKYSDGSIANLIYSTIGNKDIGKERIEIMGGGNLIILEDFKRLSINGNLVELKDTDKGYFNELVEFANLLKGKKSKTLSMDEAIAVTKLTFNCLKKL